MLLFSILVQLNYEILNYSANPSTNTPLFLQSAIISFYMAIFILFCIGIKKVNIINYVDYFYPKIK